MARRDPDQTRAALLAGAVETLRTDGIAGLSARRLADRAGVNQALIFYHFGSVAELVDVACRRSAEAAVEHYRARFAAAQSFGDLLRVGRELHETERGAGNVTLMAQLMAAAQQNPTLAATARHCLALWTAEIEPVVRRVVTGTAIAVAVDPAGLARAVSAGFLGLELYEGVDPAGAGQALDALERLAVLADVVEALGPVARRALQARLRRSGRTRPAPRT